MFYNQTHATHGHYTKFVILINKHITSC